MPPLLVFPICANWFVFETCMMTPPLRLTNTVIKDLRSCEVSFRFWTRHAFELVSSSLVDRFILANHQRIFPVKPNWLRYIEAKTCIQTWSLFIARIFNNRCLLKHRLWDDQNQCVQNKKYHFQRFLLFSRRLWSRLLLGFVCSRWTLCEADVL